MNRAKSTHLSDQKTDVADKGDAMKNHIVGDNGSRYILEALSGDVSEITI